MVNPPWGVDTIFLPCHECQEAGDKHVTNRRLVHRTEEAAREGKWGPTASMSTGYSP